MRQTNARTEKTQPSNFGPNFRSNKSLPHRGKDTVANHFSAEGFLVVTSGATKEVTTRVGLVLKHTEKNGLNYINYPLYGIELETLVTESAQVWIK